MSFWKTIADLPALTAITVTPVMIFLMMAATCCFKRWQSSTMTLLYSNYLCSFLFAVFVFCDAIYRHIFNNESIVFEIAVHASLFFSNSIDLTISALYHSKSPKNVSKKVRGMTLFVAALLCILLSTVFTILLVTFETELSIGPLQIFFAVNGVSLMVTACLMLVSIFLRKKLPGGQAGETGLNNLTNTALLIMAIKSVTIIFSMAFLRNYICYAIVVPVFVFISSLLQKKIKMDTQPTSGDGISQLANSWEVAHRERFPMKRIGLWTRIKTVISRKNQVKPNEASTNDPPSGDNQEVPPPSTFVISL